MDRRQRLIDTVFLVGIVFKGLDGLGELLIGLPLLVLQPPLILAMARAATAGELRADPNDFLANLLLREANALTTSAAVFGGVYLVLHGVVKLAIVIALFRGSRRVYPWAIAALLAFLAFQIGDLVVHPTVGVALLTAFDALIIWLTWREWRHGRTLHAVWRGVVRAWFPPRMRAVVRQLRARAFSAVRDWRRSASRSI